MNTFGLLQPTNEGLSLGRSERKYKRLGMCLSPALLCFMLMSLPAMACNNDWKNSVDSAGNLNFTENASLEGGCGLEVTVDASNPAYVIDDTPGTLAPAVTQYLARFYLAQDELNLEVDDELVLLAAYTHSDTPVFEVLLVEDNDARKIRLQAYQDGGHSVSNAGHEVVLLSGWRAVQVEWKSASGAGFLKLKVDGVAATGMQNLTSLNNGSHELDSVRMGVVNGGHLTTDSSGKLKFDAFASYREGDAGLIDKNCSGHTPTLAHITFLPGSKTCVGTSTLSTGSLVGIDSGADVTFISPEFHFQAGFSVSAGGTLRAASP